MRMNNLQMHRRSNLNRKEKSRINPNNKQSGIHCAINNVRIYVCLTKVKVKKTFSITVFNRLSALGVYLRIHWAVTLGWSAHGLFLLFGVRISGTTLNIYLYLLICCEIQFRKYFLLGTGSLLNVTRFI